MEHCSDYQERNCLEDDDKCQPAEIAGGVQAGKHLRADARRNVESLVAAAKNVFATSGVDAPVREIADMAGVGLGTLYRHFPKRSDLIVAVFCHEINACAAEAQSLAAAQPPGKALRLWIDRYVDVVATKVGLSAALHSGDPAYDNLYGYFEAHLCPALKSLLDAAAAVGEVRDDIDPTDLLLAVARLSGPISGPENSYSAKNMVALLLDGLARNV